MIYDRVKFYYARILPHGIILNCQLSIEIILNCQFHEGDNCQLSIINYQLSIIN